MFSMKKQNQALPKLIKKYFWGDSLQNLNWETHQDYISQTILEKGNETAVRWLLKKIDKKQLKNNLSHLKLDHKSKNFWSLYLA